MVSDEPKRWAASYRGGPIKEIFQPPLASTNVQEKVCVLPLPSVHLITAIAVEFSSATSLTEHSYRRDLATDGLQILAVTMTDAQFTTMEGESSYFQSRSLS